MAFGKSKLFKMIFKHMTLTFGSRDVSMRQMTQGGVKVGHFHI